MKEIIKVKKRNGLLEYLDIEKINRVVQWATEGKNNVSASQILMQAKIQFYDGIQTKDIHRTLIKSCADLISETSPEYAEVAGNLHIFALRKEAYGDFTPPKLYDHITKLTNMGKYDKAILEDYTKEEIDVLDKAIDHSKDMLLTYTATVQFEGKYLVKDRVNDIIFETPQFLYMLVSASLFSKTKNDRINKIIKFYDAISNHKLSLPTPIMSGVRTPTRQFSSCVKIEVDDSLDSINAGSSSVVKYVSQRAGIGLNLGRIRAIGSPIRGGEAYHTGCIPFFKLFQSAVKSCSQGGVRGGAATVFFPFWHREFENLVVLKNNRGTDDNRVRHLDYGVQLNKTAYQRLINKGKITLFSPHDVPDLYDAFFEDQERFEELYEEYELDSSIQKKTITAIDLFSSLMNERSSTGRIYIQNVDHSNTHSSFISSIAPIRQSNLCLEITLPTKPIQSLDDENSEIALCTLSAFNLGKINVFNDQEMEEISDLIVEALDLLLDYQDYPILAAKNSTLRRRSLGIGVINYAYFLAKNNVKYSDGTANNLTHRVFERIQYYLLKSSNKLAKEYGACELFNQTKYSKGILPIDTYKKDIDQFITVGYEKEWEELRKDILKDGLRNSTLTAIMPCETSSQISNGTNGIEPPRGLVSIKSSKDGSVKQVVPEVTLLKDKYELLWDIKNNTGYLQLVGIMQKFVDQAISANTNYDPKNYPEDKVPLALMLKDLTTAYKYGLKTLYYHNTRDGSGEDVEDDNCSGGACKL